MTELLSPAGDFETALAAFNAGADAVYCGLSDFSARAFATNFSPEELRDLLRFARAGDGSRRVYVTFNTLLDESNLESAIETLALLEDIGPDALIIQDLGIARLCRQYFPKLTLHASTQLVAHNLEGVLALGELGFSRVVLARELSLEEIISIQKRCGDIELEVFIHGALCYAVSGLCLFSAVEKGRSGNRGRCAYCCRIGYEKPDGGRTLAFSMKDLRLGEDARRLADAGIASLKIEGRMKSALYVASVTAYYRNLLSPDRKNTQPGFKPPTIADLETVFSRRTTELRFNGENSAVIDPSSLGHLGTPIGTVKRVTKDREGRRWLRFHTARALEKHDGLQFANPEGKPFGFGIGDMRLAISRTFVFEAAAGSDVEIAMPEIEEFPLRPGDTVYCSMSNAVKRAFPTPSFRSSDYPGTIALDLTVTLTPAAVTVQTAYDGEAVEISINGDFSAAKDAGRTYAAIEKAFSRLGGTDYRLAKLNLNDADRLFIPATVLNDLRRDLVEKLDALRQRRRRERIEAAEAAICPPPLVDFPPSSVVRIREDQTPPPGKWTEIVISIASERREAPALPPESGVRLGLPVWNGELTFNRLRSRVKQLIRAGYRKWEASDLATLRMLRALGVTDITADWTLYAFNSQALAQLTELGVSRIVASPENNRENLQFLAESGMNVEFLIQQSTPLFVSLHKPEPQQELAVYQRDGIWVTTRATPRAFDSPDSEHCRVDISWDPPCL